MKWGQKPYRFSTLLLLVQRFHVSVEEEKSGLEYMEYIWYSYWNVCWIVKANQNFAWRKWKICWTICNFD